MNIYKVSRTDSGGYDTYDSMVVIAEKEKDARQMHPSSQDGYMSGSDYEMWKNHTEENDDQYYYYSGINTWVEYSNIHTLIVELIGTAVSNIQSVVIASFNAG